MGKLARNERIKLGAGLLNGISVGLLVSTAVLLGGTLVDGAPWIIALGAMAVSGALHALAQILSGKIED